MLLNNLAKQARASLHTRKKKNQFKAGSVEGEEQADGSWRTGESFLGGSALRLGGGGASVGGGRLD
jgi:hypothetical protein